jgi:glucan phosphoethanolaminetransferase (alkaline phosphatase superfamily)
MELLEIGFALLLIKMAFCVFTGVFGVYFLVSSEGAKREMRNAVCRALFGSLNAIRFAEFARRLRILGAILVIVSVVSSWFLLLRGLFVDA